jgi:class 3 adenylate cyclase
MAYHLKLRLSQIAEPLLIEHNRRFFKSTGDGFLATFASCNSALIATAQIEERIQQRNLKTSNAPIHYRLALHYGDTWAITTGGEDIHGHDVNVTFRIEGVQAPSFADPKINFPVRDRILCSEMFLKALRSETGGMGGFQVLPCGSAALKGIEMPVAIHWVVTRFSDQATVRSAAVSPSA